jgi:hypothetical protein
VRRAPGRSDGQDPEATSLVQTSLRGSQIQIAEGMLHMPAVASYSDAEVRHDWE